ncbi:hypothetical protein ON010_g12992 [Phytophthora cinnamomi]|nr:hypothetical protein ON010_g12992 [Phytophthora cinnamomi]
MYDVVKETFEDKVFHISADERATSPLYIKLLAGATSGGIGSALVNPMDLVKVRMQADRTGARYRNSFVFACRQIYQQEGLAEGFYRGVAATTYRAMALTAAQLPSYDHMKHTLLTHTSLEEGVTVHMISSMFAGLMAATASSPMDVMKTQIQNEAKSGGSNVLGRAFMTVLRTEGVRGFFKGWLPNWFRLGPHTIISLMKTLYNKGTYSRQLKIAWKYGLVASQRKQWCNDGTLPAQSEQQYLAQPKLFPWVLHQYMTSVRHAAAAIFVLKDNPEKNTSTVSANSRDQLVDRTLTNGNLRAKLPPCPP